MIDEVKSNKSTSNPTWEEFNASSEEGGGWGSPELPEDDPKREDTASVNETDDPVSVQPQENATFGGGWGEDDKKGSADIVFLVDVTGSMTPCIDALRSSIKTFLSELVHGSENIAPTQNWRARVVGYRDYPYDHERSYGWICDHDFTRDPNAVEQQLDDLKAKGGGLSPEGVNDPESLLDAVQLILDSGELPESENEMCDKRWRSHIRASRIMVVFTDAPFHEKMSTPGHEDEDFDMLADRLISFNMHGFMYVPSMTQYEITFSELPNFVIIDCGEGADGLAGTMSDPEKLRDILVKLQRGISTSASAY